MRNGKKGFTFIELILAISISLILLGRGLVKYQDFNRKQQVKQSALDFISVLRQAQNRAITGDKPTGCADPFTGFRVAPALNTNQYTVSAVCNGSNFSSQTKNLRSTFVNFINPSQATTFAPLYGTAAGATITLRHKVDTTISETIVVSAGGDISCMGCD